MRTTSKMAMSLAAMTFCGQAAADVVFYERESFEGRSFTTAREVRNLERRGFDDRASSAEVRSGRWEVCDGERFRGNCMVLRAGKYPSLSAMGLSDRVSSVRPVSSNARIDDSRYAPAAPPQRSAASPLITFYDNEGFQGRAFNTGRQVVNMERAGFNDRASSVVVIGDRWEVCESSQFRGKCTVLRQGRYPSLTATGLNRVSSVRLVSGSARIDDSRYAPAPLPVYDDRRRRNERTYEAKVTSVRAVLGTPEQRCWIEKEALPASASNVSIPGALIGAVIGGVLGHQVGSGSGNTAATIGGAVVGGAAGSQVGRLGIGTPQAQTRDVQRCDTVSSEAKPDYWDVTYDFRGQEHRIQTLTPPGSTVTVNERGEPRA